MYILLYFSSCYRLIDTSMDNKMVPEAGLEPAHPKAVDFESTASTDFATQALSRMRKTSALYLSDNTAQALSLKFHLTGLKIADKQ